MQRKNKNTVNCIPRAIVSPSRVHGSDLGLLKEAKTKQGMPQRRGCINREADAVTASALVSQRARCFLHTNFPTLSWGIEDGVLSDWS